MNNDGEPVARLSKKAKSRWVNRLSDVDEGRVVAMVRRYKTDIKDEEFRERCFGYV
jgi:ATP-dependent DNA helicase RecQ